MYISHGNMTLTKLLTYTTVIALAVDRCKGRIKHEMTFCSSSTFHFHLGEGHIASTVYCSGVAFQQIYRGHSSSNFVIFAKLCSFSNFSFTSPTSQLILQPFRRFTYVAAHSTTLPFPHIRHNSFSKPLFRFSYVICSSLTSPGQPPMM